MIIRRLFLEGEAKVESPEDSCFAAVKSGHSDSGQEVDNGQAPDSR